MEKEEDKKVQPEEEVNTETVENEKPSTESENSPTEETPPAIEAPTEEKKPSKRDKLREMLSARFEGYNPEDEESNAEIIAGYIKNNDEQSAKLAEALAKDPRLAQALSDIASGKRGSAGALARYFGKDFLSAEEGTPEAEEIAKAEEERKKELDDYSASKKVYDENIDKTMPSVIDFCKEHGYEPNDFLGRVWDEIISPIFDGTYTPELLAKLDKAFNYDKDVNDALEAGEVKGRNLKIQKMREDEGDGMPKALVTENAPIANKKKHSSGMIGLAKMA